MKKKQVKNNAIIYQAKNGAIELHGDISRGTIWATQAQIAEVFGVERSVVTKHIRNLLTDKEIDEKSNVQKMHIANSDKPVARYSLDIILAVGYRANSKRAIEFRQWATKTLREHITRGYTINRKRVMQNYDAFMKSVADVQALLPGHAVLDPKSVRELIKEFSGAWVSIEEYDKGPFTAIGSTKKAVKLTVAELTGAILNLRVELMGKGGVTDIFAQERNAGSVEGIVGNVMQSFEGKQLYASIEEKAAHLLYFMVKDHPFVDGNKRSGAFSFVWFLRKTGNKGCRNINPATLTVLTLLIAESDPNKKDQVVALVTRILR